MPLRKRMISLFLVLACTNVFAEENFRTPARRYGSAYSVKITVKKGLTDYVVPMWIKPEQAESYLDYNQLKTLGWSEPLNPKKQIIEFDDVSVVGTPLEKTSFKNGKADLVHFPEFPKGCCFGVLGRDILSQYQLRFIPGMRSAIEWTKIDSDPKVKTDAGFIQSVAQLFSVQSELVTYQKVKYDLSNFGYTLNLSQNKITFEPAPLTQEEKKLKPYAQPIFAFEFIPPLRKLEVMSIQPAYQKSAQKVGFKRGMVISEINDKYVFLYDQFEVNAWLKGKRSGKLVLTVDKQAKPFVFDFTKKEFITE